MEMRKGIIFSIDAMFALAIVALLFSTLLISPGAGKNDGPREAAAQFAASDKAVVAQLDKDNGPLEQVPAWNSVYCEQFAKYGDDGVVDNLEVRECEQLE